jgi:hypothetical protein
MPAEAMITQRNKRTKHLGLAALAVVGIVYTFRLNPNGLDAVGAVVVAILTVVAIVMIARGFKL